MRLWGKIEGKLRVISIHKAIIKIKKIKIKKIRKKSENNFYSKVKIFRKKFFDKAA